MLLTACSLIIVEKYAKRVHNQASEDIVPQIIENLFRLLNVRHDKLLIRNYIRTAAVD